MITKTPATNSRIPANEGKSSLGDEENQDWWCKTTGNAGALAGLPGLPVYRSFEEKPC